MKINQMARKIEANGACVKAFGKFMKDARPRHAVTLRHILKAFTSGVKRGEHPSNIDLGMTASRAIVESEAPSNASETMIDAVERLAGSFYFLVGRLYAYADPEEVKLLDGMLSCIRCAGYNTPGAGKPPRIAIQQFLEEDFERRARAEDCWPEWVEKTPTEESQETETDRATKEPFLYCLLMLNNSNGDFVDQVDMTRAEFITMKRRFAEIHIDDDPETPVSVEAPATEETANA